jgi:hypothetical protein
LEHLDILGPNNRLYGPDVWMVYEHGQALPDHRFAADWPELLGHIAAHPRSSPGGDNDDCDPCHAVDAPELPLGFSAFLL